MENRSRKRDELTEQLPADKRVCSSSPNSSSVQTQMNSAASESPDCEMEATSSSASVSGRSEGEAEKDSASGCDSDDMDESEQRHKIFRDYYHRRSSLDQGKIRRIATSLKEEAGPGSQLAGLTELCDVLSFSTEELPSSSADLLAPVLVGLAKQEENPDIMLLSIRCITYLCDALTRSSGILVRHDVIPALCSRLMTIEYLDVAEQCLQALEKISRDHPLACLEAGVIMASLNYIDFFCTSIQRVALATVANVCKRLPPDRASLLMEAVPILCNLLNYEDQKLVEIVATCLIRIVDRVKHSSEMLEELCNHGLIHQATNLIEFNGRSPLSQPVYTGLIGLLCRFASGSVSAVRTLLELNVSSTLSHILSSYDFTRPPVSVVGGEQCNQVHELMKLLNELLPPLTRNSEEPAITSEKERILGDQPELLRQFGFNILPVLIQVVNSGVNLYMCYCCLSHIRKIVHFSRPDMLLEFLKNTNISSFLAGAFTRKDRHVLILILEIVEDILKKLPDVFANSFIKEGVVYAIDALLIPGNCSEFSFPISACIQFSSGSTQKSVTKDAFRCLCYAFDVEKSPSPGTTMCKLEKDCVLTSAMRIKDSYFATESHISGVGLPENLLKLKNLCSLLVEKVHDGSMVNDICVQQEENLSQIVSQMLTLLNAGEYMSTFEFIESGIVKSLVTYLSNDHYMKQNMDQRSYSNRFDVILSRLEKFARYSFLLGGQNWEGMPIAILIKKLQSALSSLENFPVILSHGSKSRNSYATIPFGRCTLNPCLKVRFVREEGEVDLCDYSADVATVEPFSTLYDIEKFLLPKVSTKRVERCAKLVDQSTDQQKATPIQGPSSSCYPQSEDESPKETDNASPCAADAQEVKAQLSSTPEEAVEDVPGEASLYLGQPPVAVTEDLQPPVAVTSSKFQDSAKTTTSTVAICSRNSKGSGSTACNDGDVLPKLSFYLKGKQIDQESTLFQAILQQKVKEEHEVVVGPGFWNEIYQVTYRKAAEPKINPVESLSGSQISSAQGSHLIYPNIPLLYSIFASELCYGVEKSEPTYEILFLLKILEGVNRFAFQLLSQERKRAFSNGELQNLDDLVVMTPTVPPTEFVNIKLTEKLEQQLRDQLAVSTGSMPSWCCQLMVSSPYLFGFEAKSKYFRQVVFGSLHGQPQLWSHAVNSNSISPTHRNSHGSGLRRKKFQVSRSNILDSAAKMMEQHAQQKTVLEVEYNEEVGTGLGPTMEFYTLVSHEFQKVGLGMWRGDHSNFTSEKESMVEDSGLLLAPLGFFPRPLSHTSNSLSESQSTEVMKKFVLLGQIVAKTLQDGRVLDLLFSKAFYKLILEQELNIYDIQSIDPQLGRTLLEFQALTDMKRVSRCVPGMPLISDSCFRNTKIEDLWLDFSLPGYPDYMLSSGDEHKMVNFLNLEEYVSSVVDATVSTGISRQVEAFKSGFNQVFPITSLRIFTEGELERLLCGEQDAWTSEDLLEHIKFDHGYTVSSPPIINLLEIVQDFNYDQKRAFLQFVTGAPRLPPGGLAALNPQLTVVRKHCSECVDGDLPSVMTCANYLKLPPYSSKERMRERLLFAITEGQGSFHLS